MTLPAVLVVDPNPATLRRVAEAFHGTAFDLLSARDAREAEARANGHDLALVLASASLPGGNGYDLARLLRDRYPAAAVLLMTGGFEVYNSARAEEAGVAGHLAKPFSAEGLRRLVEETIGPLSDRSDSPAPPSASVARQAEEPRAATGPSAPDPYSIHRHRPMASGERIATILPRDYKDLPLVAVDPDVVGPALERAVLEVLPEVVEALLRQALVASPAFRDLVAVAVEEAVREQLPALATRVVEARLAELEGIEPPK